MIGRNLVVLVFGIVGCSSTVRAQTGFIRTYSLPSDVEITGADATPDGGLILCGASVDDGFLMRLDETGNVLWSRTYETFGTAAGGGPIVMHWPRIGFRDVAAVSDSNYVVVGEGYGDSLVGEQQIMGRFDDPGNAVWSSSYTNNWGGRNFAVDRESADTVLVGGSFIQGQEHIFSISRVAANTGVSSLAPQIGGLGSTTPVALDCSDDGSIVIASYHAGNTCFIVKYDHALNIVWKHSWTGFNPCAVQGLSDGSVYAAGDQTLLRLNSSGTVDWARNITVGTGDIADMLVRPDGKVLLLGWSSGQGVHSWLAQFDTTGTIEWIQRYGDVGDDIRLTELDRRSDGSLRMIGMNGTDAIVVATDSTGASLSCSYPVPVYSVSAITPAQQADPYHYNNSLIWQPLAPIGTVQYIPASSSCANAAPYRASGTVFNDLDLDGILDPGEPGLPYLPVSVTPNNGYLFTSASGEFIHRPWAMGSYMLTSALPAPWWQFTVGGSGYPITFTPLDTVFEDLHFGLAPLNDTTLLEATMSRGVSPCWSYVDFDLTVANQGTTTPQGVVSVTMDPRYVFVSATPMADSIVADTYYWAFDSLQWYQSTQRTLRVLRPNTMYIWDTLVNVVRIWEDDGLGTLTLTDTTVWQEVHTCPFDPNDKQVDPQGDGPLHVTPHDIEWLTYTVRFQNTGNDTAYTVVIEDLLSPFLDHGTLQVMAYSHDLTGLSIGSAGLAEFRFDNIMLPDSNVNYLGSQGFVTYRIRPNPGVPHVSDVSNNAAIYFDLNDPVITNTVHNTFVNCAESTVQSGVFDNGNGYLLAYTNSMDTMTYQYQWILNGTPIPGSNDMVHFVTGNGQYSVAVTDLYGCSAVSPEITVIITSVSGTEAFTAAVVPNPFDHFAQVFFSRALTTADMIRVIDLQGRLLRSMRGNGTNKLLLDRGDLASGMYVLQVFQAQEQVGSVRMVVE